MRRISLDSSHGKTYEMEFAKDANIKPPRGYHTPLEVCFLILRIFTLLKKIYAIVC
jgi:hypothetical protein